MLIENNAKYSIDDLMPLIRECIDSGRLVNMRVTGSSMYPLFIDRRDMVTLKKTDKVKKYDIVLHRRENGKYILHRVIKKRGDILTIAGDCETEKEYPVSTSQVIAKVSAFTRKGEQHSVDEPIFKIYAFIWVLIFPFRRGGMRLIRRVRRVFLAKK